MKKIIGAVVVLGCGVAIFYLLRGKLPEKQQVSGSLVGAQVITSQGTTHTISAAEAAAYEPCRKLWNEGKLAESRDCVAEVKARFR